MTETKAVDEMTSDELKAELRELPKPEGHEGKWASGTVPEMRERLKAARESAGEGETGEGESLPERPTLVRKDLVTCKNQDCKATSADRVIVKRKEVQAVYVYATSRQGSVRVKYCKCRHCGRSFDLREVVSAAKAAS